MLVRSIMTNWYFSVLSA